MEGIIVNVLDDRNNHDYSGPYITRFKHIIIPDANLAIKIVPGKQFAFYPGFVLKPGQEVVKKIEITEELAKKIQDVFSGLLNYLQ